MAAALYLVRHGQSYSNVEHRLYAIPPGPGLTALGQSQAARATRLVLERATPEAVLSSPLRRALETAEPLVRATGVRMGVVDDLRETGFGQWEGVAEPDMAGQPAWQRWTADPDRYPPPGGERLSEVAARVRSALDIAARRFAGQTIAAFSHHDSMLAFYLSVTDSPYSGHAPLAIPNTCILAFEHDGMRWTYLGADRRAAIKDVPGDDDDEGIA